MSTRTETLTVAEKISVKALVAVLIDNGDAIVQDDPDETDTDEEILGMIEAIEFDDEGTKAQRTALKKLRGLAEAHDVTLLEMYWEACR